MASEDPSRRLPDPIEPHVAAFGRLRQAAQTAEHLAPRRPHGTGIAALVCAALVTIGSWGPWLHVVERPGRPTDTLRGTESDGALSLVAGVVAFVALVTALIRVRAGIPAGVALIALGLAALIGGGSWLDMAAVVDGYEGTHQAVEAEVGWGPKVVTVAGFLGLSFAYRVFKHLHDV